MEGLVDDDPSGGFCRTWQETAAGAWLLTVVKAASRTVKRFFDAKQLKEHIKKSIASA